MAKYRKKPVVIEAMQLKVGTSFRSILEFAGDNRAVYKNEKGEVIIRTLEGDMKANVGDYIIKGVQGEIYPCKPDIFEATYERVDK